MMICELLVLLISFGIGVLFSYVCNWFEFALL